MSQIIADFLGLASGIALLVLGIACIVIAINIGKGRS